MTDREKLVELLDIIIQPGQKTLGEIADHLIANGVTVREPQKPLTVEEMSYYIGEIIWKEEPMVGINPIKIFFCGHICAEFEEFGIKEDCELPFSHYNYTWRCWAEKPTEEERKAAEWET